MKKLSEILFSLVFVSCLLALVNAEEPVDDLPLWRKYSDKSVLEHRLKIPGDEETKVVFLKKPVFVHNFNLNVESHAMVYLWVTEEGRPIAAVTTIVLRYDQDVDRWNEIDEFHSFHDRAILVERSGRAIWGPQGPGVDWQEIPTAPEPAATGKLQAIQARKLAREFSVKATYHREDGRDWNLRLVPTPVHKFATDKDGQVVSGYLHVFCRANDPEAMLALEVRRLPTGEYRWHYATANFSNAGVHVMLNEKEVWKEDPARFGQTYRHYGVQSRANFSLESER